MIRLIIGGIGSGKSVSAIKDITDTNIPTFCNFNVKLNRGVRLKVDHIIKREVIGHNQKGQPQYKEKVNWEFWNTIKSDGFNICIDEIHNVLHARRSMTKWNTLFSMWLAQIRKILGESKKYNLTLITQKLGRVDISARDLATEIIYVSKTQEHAHANTKCWNNQKKRYEMKKLPLFWIKKHHFVGTYCQEKFDQFMSGIDSFDYSTYFLANPYFQFYDSYELLDFGEETYV